MGVASQCYKIRSLAGFWYQGVMIFTLPIYWLISPIFRRARVMTTADFFERRFGANFMRLYAVFALLMLVAAGILQYVFIGLSISKLNQFWDKRTAGKAVAARYGKGEIAVIVVGVLVSILNYSGGGSEPSHDFENSSVGAVTLVRS